MNVDIFGFDASLVPTIQKAALSALKHERKSASAINLILISDEEIKKLNAKFRKVRRITDVISFLFEPPNSSPKTISGDIYIAKERSQKQARRFGHTWDKELAYLTIHGILHLCGYSDYERAAKKEMFGRQDKIFQCLF
jgi:probable rRNA maturation factor